MKYVDDGGLWRKMREAAELYGRPLEKLDSLFGLDDGMLEFMAENGIVPEDELLDRFTLFTGMSREQLITNVPPQPRMDVRREVFLLRDAGDIKDAISMENVVYKLNMDRPVGDNNRYIAAFVNSESMTAARIYPGDVVVIRRQAIAEDGDVVAADFGGKTIIRRFRRLHNVIWLEAEGKADDGPLEISDNLESMERSITIYGKVMYTTRIFDKSELLPV
ncbi:MAG: hypothetical protein J1F63_03000 [Oscillospiraceae bacterium]|nr:hypothetical protein [Oscillospiraceae bacterium]